MSGLLPWGRAELPEPLPLSFRNALRTIGPGAILLATSIGGGEWLVGPAVGVKHGVGLFWIATVAIALQLLFNLEAIRYTLYSGEPIVAGFMRLRPASTFWAVLYTLLAVAQLGMPALGAACATVIFAAQVGRLPGPLDTDSLRWITYGVMAVTLIILTVGATIERMLERASWAMIIVILVFLFSANVFFVPFDHWLDTAIGFVTFGYWPPGTDVLLLTTLAATAGSGGVGNLVISNWVRDKGLGMGATVGAIPSAFGGRKIHLSPVGKVFDVDDESLRRWRLWRRYVFLDQAVLWAGGCFLGMYLNVNLATSIVPLGVDLAGVGAGAVQAKYMAERLWSGFWVLALLNGFWILFSTHLGNTDTLVRTVTDIIWVGSKSRWKTEKVGRIYYSLLLLFTTWGLITTQWGTAMTLFQALGVVASLVLAVGAIQILRVNTYLLPAELRPPVWIRAGLLVCAGFYAVMFGAALLR
jgi:hypothetical protein